MKVLSRLIAAALVCTTVVPGLISEAKAAPQGWVGPSLVAGHSQPMLTADGHIIGMAWNSEAPYYALSSDGGITFSTPRRLVPASGTTHTYKVESIAAGENGVWMATVVKRALAETDETLLLAISKDFGKTWQLPKDVTSLLIDRPGERFVGSFKVGYADDSTWVLFAGKTKTTSPTAETSWVRLSNDGTQIGERQSLADVSEVREIYSRPRGQEIMIAYADGSGGVARFSYDNGATFEPAIPFEGVAATDGRGQWILAEAPSLANSIAVRHSANHGHSFQAVPSPADPNLFQWIVQSAAFSVQGEIVITAGARDTEMEEGAGFPPMPDLVTRATAGTWTWQPWDQFEGAFSLNSFYSVVANDRNQFVAAGYKEQAPENCVYQYYYHGTSPAPACAADWQLFN